MTYNYSLRIVNISLDCYVGFFFRYQVVSRKNRSTKIGFLTMMLLLLPGSDVEDGIEEN